MAIVGALAASPWARLPAATTSAGLSGSPGGGVPAGAFTDAEFDRSLLPAGSQAQDLSRFEHGNPVLPGVYRIDVYLDGTWSGRADVRFVASSPEASATPCFDRPLLERLGVDLHGLSSVARQRLDAPGACVAVDRVLPGAHARFDQGELRLDVSVPQASMSRAPRGYVAPRFWNEGITAASLNYDFNGFRTHRHGRESDRAYLGLRAGFNLGAWRARYDSALTWQSGQGRMWQKIRAYVQRDLPSMHAQLTVGDTFTRGDIFDAVALRGVQVATDDRMLPQSQRGYAPVVRGVARSNAEVSVSQNGVLIYRSAVPPGPFVIDDMYPTGYGGDLDVTVTEANGSQHRFRVPYASVPQLLRPGATRFSVAVGTLRDDALGHRPWVAQGTWQRGFGAGFTGYAGIDLAQGYRALLAGSAFNTRYGAVALDLTGTGTDVPGRGTRDGRSVRLSYSKLFSATGTSLTVAAYRYGTRGYLDLHDAAALRDDARRGLDTGRVQRRRSRFDLNVYQPLGVRGGSLYATGSRQDYWDRPGHDTQLQVGYQGVIGAAGYSVSAARVRDALGRPDNQFYFNLSIPLGASPRAPDLTVSVTEGGGGRQQQAMLTGTSGDDQQFTYGATFSRAGASSGSVNAGYRGPYATVGGGFERGGSYTQASLGVSGGVLAHAGGVTFGQSMGETVGLVHAADAAGARVLNGAGVRVDGRGYALVPYLNPYSRNQVELDPRGLPVDVQVDATTQSVVPTAGAVMPVQFRTSRERTAIFRVRRPDGAPLPFGAAVEDGGGSSVGVVAQGGRIFARGMPAQGHLVVRWDSGARLRAGQCGFDYRLPPRADGDPDRYQYIDVACIGPATGADHGDEAR